ncbi:MAG: DoxX family protein [Gemmatimonadetes bacterium]|nr:DoxX family protein [Gemmatimonadota bacterium]
MSELLDWLYLIGRILFSMIFLMSGLGHFMKVDDMTGYAASRGVPAPKASVILSGTVLLAGGLSVLLGVWMEIGVWLLFFFLVLAGLLVHTFWKMEDPMQAQSEQAQFMKNLALAGACLVFYWMIQAQGYGPFTLGSPMG